MTLDNFVTLLAELAEIWEDYLRLNLCIVQIRLYII
jgi:hypothetical protein